MRLLAKDFLQKCSWVGLQLTLSIAGGDKGQRRYPLMTGDKSWKILQDRLVSLLKKQQATMRSEKFSGR